jgi:general stress protein 26
MIQRSAVSMLLTIDDRGAQSGRPMLPLFLPSDPHIYFLTHQSSLKVSQVLVQPQVAMTIVGAHCYAVVVGRADVVREPGIINDLWRPTYRAWFPEGKDDREAVVLRLTVERVDYWEPPRSRVVRLVQAVRAVITHQAVETPMKTIDRL